MRIQEIHTKEEIEAVYPIMNQLRTHLTKDMYMDLVQEAMDNDRYHMAAGWDGGEIVAVIGFKPMTTLYYGRFVWVCDLITDSKKRSKGYGEILLSYVEEWARDRTYEKVALSSGLQRFEAHRFYEEKMQYEKASYVFKKDVTN